MFCNVFVTFCHIVYFLSLFVNFVIFVASHFPCHFYISTTTLPVLVIPRFDMKNSPRPSETPITPFQDPSQSKMRLAVCKTSDQKSRVFNHACTQDGPKREAAATPHDVPHFVNLCQDWPIVAQRHLPHFVNLSQDGFSTESWPTMGPRSMS